jgi:hypothetical protein
MLLAGALLPAPREAARLLNIVLDGLDPPPAGDAPSWRMHFRAPPVFLDQLGLWIKARQGDAVSDGDDLLTRLRRARSYLPVQAEAGDLLLAIFRTLNAKFALLDDEVLFSFTVDIPLFERLNLWGCAVEDVEPDEDDEEDGSAEEDWRECPKLGPEADACAIAA